VALKRSSFRLKRVQKLKEIYDSDRITLESNLILKNDCWNKQMHLSTDKECLYSENIKEEEIINLVGNHKRKRLSICQFEETIDISSKRILINLN